MPGEEILDQIKDRPKTFQEETKQIQIYFNELSKDEVLTVILTADSGSIAWDLDEEDYQYVKEFLIVLSAAKRFTWEKTLHNLNEYLNDLEEEAEGMI